MPTWVLLRRLQAAGRRVRRLAGRQRGCARRAFAALIGAEGAVTAWKRDMLAARSSPATVNRALAAQFRSNPPHSSGDKPGSVHPATSGTVLSMFLPRA